MASQAEAEEVKKIDVEAQTTESESNLTIGWRFDVLFGLPLLAIMPMCYLEFGSLWSRIHTQFFPLPLVAVLALVISQASITSAASIKRLTVSYVLLLIGSILVAANFWMFSPWIAHLCAILFISGWALTRFAKVAWPRILGWTTLLATTMRLPGNLDIQVLGFLEGAGASIASSVLDGLSMPYLHRPNAIMIAGLNLGEVRELYVDETVRNLFSLYAMISVTVLILIMQHRSLIVGALTLLSMPLWYVLYVVIQLLAVFLFMKFAERDISQDRDWIMLSLLNFVVVTLLVVCFIQCLAKLTLPVPASDGEFEPEFQLINAIMCWPQRDPFQLEESDILTPLLVKPPEDLATWRASTRILQRLGIACAGIATLMAVSTSTRAISNNRSLGALPTVNQEMLGTTANQETMPAKIEDFERVDFQSTIEPRNKSDHGVLSWKYVWQGQVIDLRVEFPFHGAQASQASIFERQGWRILRQEAMQAENAESTADETPKSAEDVRSNQRALTWVEIHLENELDGRAIALVRFDTLDRSIELTSQSLDPSYQVQLFCESGTELTRSQLRAIRRAYTAMLDILDKNLNFQSIIESKP